MITYRPPSRRSRKCWLTVSTPPSGESNSWGVYECIGTAGSHRGHVVGYGAVIRTSRTIGRSRSRDRVLVRAFGVDGHSAASGDHVVESALVVLGERVLDGAHCLVQSIVALAIAATGAPWAVDAVHNRNPAVWDVGGNRWVVVPGRGDTVVARRGQVEVEREADVAAAAASIPVSPATVVAEVIGSANILLVRFQSVLFRPPLFVPQRLLSSLVRPPLLLPQRLLSGSSVAVPVRSSAARHRWRSV